MGQQLCQALAVLLRLRCDAMWAEEDDDSHRPVSAADTLPAVTQPALLSLSEHSPTRVVPTVRCAQEG